MVGSTGRRKESESFLGTQQKCCSGPNTQTSYLKEKETKENA